MANQLQLQRQIQEEIDREAKIDKTINRKIKTFLTTTKNLKQLMKEKIVILFYIFIEKNP